MYKFNEKRMRRKRNGQKKLRTGNKTSVEQTTRNCRRKRQPNKKKKTLFFPLSLPSPQLEASFIFNALRVIILVAAWAREKSISRWESAKVALSFSPSLFPTFAGRKRTPLVSRASPRPAAVPLLESCSARTALEERSHAIR